MRTIIVYKVGDWVRGAGSEIGSFIRITRVNKIADNDPCYDVEFYSDVFTERGLEYVGNDIGLVEARFLLLTNPKDILLCLASDLQKRQNAVLKETEELANDVEALMRSRKLL